MTSVHFVFSFYTQEPQALEFLMENMSVCLSLTHSCRADFYKKFRF